MVVGIASTINAIKMPIRRSIWRLNNATPRPAIAIPMVLGVDRKAHRAWRDAVMERKRWKNGLCCEQIDDREECGQCNDKEPEQDSNATAVFH